MTDESQSSPYPYDGICPQCGKEWASRSATRVYCSIQCLNAEETQANREATKVQPYIAPWDRVHRTYPRLQGVKRSA
jgi:endogenous inhibitor of DNA gyrase (YacG/DUF329 family)